MHRYFFMVFIGIFAALAGIYYWVAIPQIYQEPALPVQTLVHQGNKTQSIEHINITAFYFVPQDKQGKIDTYWNQSLKQSLEELTEFHESQFQGRSQITTQIFPQPIIGNYDSIDYDTTNTSGGNPHGLRTVALEVEARVYAPEGDLYHQFISDPSLNAYQVMVIMYEGVGAAGSENVAFISRTYLSEQPYRESYGPTFLVHEFYHTLGLENEYEKQSGRAFGNDIMGLGRFRPLEYTYIDQQTLKQMGIL